MAGTTPIYGLPYPQSSDLVSAYPALGQDLAEDLDGILAAKADVSSIVAPGLVLVTSQAFSGASSVSVNNCFTNTYENYRVLLSNLTNASAGLSFLSMRMRAGGVDAAGASTYNWSFRGSYGAATFDGGLTAADTMQFGGLTNGGIGWTVLDISRPFLASQTLVVSHHLGYQSDTAQYTQRLSLGAHSVTNSYDGFTIYSTTSNNIGGTLRVYGYKNS